MKRSELARKTPMNPGTKPLRARQVAPGAEPKPAKGPKPAKCAVKSCRAEFIRPQAFVKWCSHECGATLAMDKLAKQKEKAQQQRRAADKVKREGMKTYPQLIRETQRAFNAVVRFRDMLAGHACISSGRALDWSGNAVDAGHYRSTGSAPHLRFNFDNCHAQSKHDNQFKSGAAVDYRIGLIARIGLARVEALESDNAPRKWTHDELRAMKADYQRRVRELRNEIQKAITSE